MAYRAPLLNKPAEGWKHDLPGPNQPPSRTPNTRLLPNPPNYVDDIYLELARSTYRVRGLSAYMAIFFFLVSLVSLVTWIRAAINAGGIPEFALNLSGGIAFTAGLWGAVYSWRMDTEAPRDEPIRFNRLRRKVYVYRFFHDGAKPFSRTAWGVRPVAYDWDDLHAEACSLYGPMGTGGFIETVTLAVLKPGTHEVIDRFMFAHGILRGEMYWAMAQLFMQQGPDALPNFPYVPRDWNNEDVSFNLARRLAPKVVWPAEMDLESRTAP
jgi:hypothetical protein